MKHSTICITAGCNNETLTLRRKYCKDCAFNRKNEYINRYRKTEKGKESEQASKEKYFNSNKGKDSRRSFNNKKMKNESERENYADAIAGRIEKRENDLYELDKYE